MHDIMIKIVFHYMSHQNNKIYERASEIVKSINDDFNNYGSHPGSNNHKYKKIVEHVFCNNPIKHKIYTSITNIPNHPSDIYFELDEIRCYAVNSIDMTAFQNESGDSQISRIKKNISFIKTNKDHLNIFIVNLINSPVIAFTSFPWDVGNFNGIVVSDRCFFPELHNETQYNKFKIFTHEIGHWLGLSHTFTKKATTDPSKDHDILFNNNYNPLFMNFMDYTFDSYVAIFTVEQIKKMKETLSLFKNNGVRSLRSQNEPFFYSSSRKSLF